MHEADIRFSNKHFDSNKKYSTDKQAVVLNFKYSFEFVKIMQTSLKINIQQAQKNISVTS